MNRFLAPVLSLLLSSLMAVGVADEPTPPPAVDKAPGVKDSEIDVWLKQLDSNSYVERQAAMVHLKAAGTAGVSALAKIARNSNPEVTARAISLLAVMYGSQDADVAIAADDALESLAEQGSPTAVVRTQEVLTTTLALERRRHAIEAIKRLGGNILPVVKWDDEGVNEIECDLNEENTVHHVVLGKRWKGGLDGMKYFSRIPELRTLSVTTDIPLTAEEQGKLKEKLPTIARIDVRGSAYMGIKSITMEPDICLIDSVVPNSPAKRAGLKPGDVITHVDGLTIQGFLGLTAALKPHNGGDTVYLEVQRQDESLEVEVVLGEW